MYKKCDGRNTAGQVSANIQYIVNRQFIVLSDKSRGNLRFYIFCFAADDPFLQMVKLIADSLVFFLLGGKLVQQVGRTGGQFVFQW